MFDDITKPSTFPLAVPPYPVLSYPSSGIVATPLYDAPGE